MRAYSVREAAEIIEIADKVGRGRYSRQGNEPRGRKRDNWSPSRTGGYQKQYPRRSEHENRQSDQRRSQGHNGGRTHQARSGKSEKSSGKAKRSSRTRNEPRLSSRERAELREQGKCFLCKETGHYANACPKANLVKSDKKGKPPGLTSYSVEIGGHSLAEQLRELAATTETSAGIDLHYVETAWDDMPDLQSVSNSSESENSDWSDTEGSVLTEWENEADGHALAGYFDDEANGEVPVLNPVRRVDPGFGLELPLIRSGERRIGDLYASSLQRGM
ncbi:hypothetical protein BD310DRAFT_995784 [Dichomitus squalens]|uniref:CCHC-type domain-containing protein n=1 Tax=Dichomitus squalens TaxID=114155 RepID=A0A4Q9PDE0_9APHY|nr:hypothetical protein BD310DRAFT_995784 [Dichomitus squalens]